MIVVEQLEKDMIEAMKNKDKERLVVIRMVKASLKQEQIDRKKEINDDLLIDVVNKQIKMRKDSISEFEKGNRQDLINKTQKEIDVLMAYLPEQLDEKEVLNIIDEIFSEVKPTSQKDMGTIMGLAQAKLKGKADMKTVSSIIKEKLNS
ncbi:MAG: GatB/YqeY domain-containing protein [Bacilli bacterium]|nr:GatB/YqeY domain-containing protein [Bacilli bacterium]